eukprot:scaffold96682_cov56-Phaeocystis_antarctica.AAC.2
MDVDGWIGYLCGRMGRPCSLHAHARVCACACACACTPQGEWSDESPLWDAHPDVQRALWPARSATPRARMNDGALTGMLHMAGYVRSQAGYTRRFLAAVRDLREDLLGRRRLRPQHRWAGFMVGRMGMRTDGQMVGGRVDGCMDGRMAGRVGGRMYTLWLALHVHVHV